MILDIIFPPLCLACKESSKYKFLCAACWDLCRLPDPIEKCRHCFSDLDERGNLCSQCRKEKILPAVRAFVFDPESPARFLKLDEPYAMAGFAVCQFIELDWPLPNAIIPMPDRDSIRIGKAFADLLNISFVKALRRNFEYVSNRIEDDAVLFLFDASNSYSDLEKGAFSLLEAFPKRIYLLSLLPYVDCTL